MRACVHAEDVPAESADLGAIAGTWHELSEAAGSVRLGVNRIVVPPGRAATPQHAEDEEVFYVLGGSGFSVQEDGCFAIAAGDVIFYRAWRPAHTVVAGEDGLDVIAFGTLNPTPEVRFPRLDAVRVGGMVVHADRTHQWELEAALGPIEIADPPDPRPSSIVNVADTEPRRLELGAARSDAWFLTAGLGAHGIALNRADILPGAEAAPPHCHSHEEELFYVLGGDGVLLLGAQEAEHPVRAGTVVARPAGTGVAHAFRAGDGGLSLLMFSDKHPGDMAFYPRTGKVSMRGLGITFRPEIVPWAGD
ncbi:MAG: Cupin 2 conserved barrel domain protein [Solirubrobacteraceae bacterium]|nr:Cupin 2 conserved barrel domain protein [Solirubrobacteraceae bacterium]